MRAPPTYKNNTIFNCTRNNLIFTIRIKRKKEMGLILLDLKNYTNCGRSWKPVIVPILVYSIVGGSTLSIADIFTPAKSPVPYPTILPEYANP